MDRALRELVWRRAEDRCEYCRMPQEYDDAPFEIDHIIAESRATAARPGLGTCAWRASVATASKDRT